MGEIELQLRSKGSYQLNFTFPKPALSRHNMAEIFAEVLEPTSDEEDQDETKGTREVTVANSTGVEIMVEVEPIKVTRQAELREKQFGIAVGLDGQLGFQVGVGSVPLESCVIPEQRQTVSPHGLWSLPIPRDSLVPWKRGKSAMVENSIQLRLFHTEDGGRSRKSEIGGGFVIGPGHGLVVSLVNGKHQVEQVRGRSWHRRFDAWITNTGGSRDPHVDLRRHRRCRVCKICDVMLM